MSDEEKDPVKDEHDFVGLSQTQLLIRKFMRNRMAVVGIIVLCLLYLSTIFAGFLAPYNYRNARSEYVNAPPQKLRFFDEEGRFHFRPFVYPMSGSLSRETFTRVYEEDRTVRNHIYFFRRGDSYQLFRVFESHIHLFGVEEGTFFPFGTDQRGRCLFSRTMVGGQISLTIGLIGVAIATVLGAVLGTISGYYGGIVDNIIQRVMEVVMSFPQVAIWMAIAAAIPPTWPSDRVFLGIVVILGLITWAILGREVRGKVLALREVDYVSAAKAAGAKDWWIMRKHLIPAVSSQILVVATIAVPSMILAESMLSFLGLGIRAPQVSWGSLLQEAQSLANLTHYPWFFIPGAFIVLSVLCFNFVGDGLRDAVDPYSV